MAVCLTGQLRKHKETFSTHIDHLLRPNNGHAYVASWAVPDDGFKIENLNDNMEYYERMYSTVTLVAVRVDFFHPQMFNKKLFKRNTGAMFFLMEACTRLVFGSGVVYDSVVRSRLDITLHAPLVIQLTPANGFFTLKIGNSERIIDRGGQAWTTTGHSKRID